MLLSFALLMTVDTPTVALVGDPALVRNEAARLQRQARVLVFPLKTGLFPAGKAYRDNAETHRVWRTLATEGVDLVLTDVASLRDALAANDVAGYGRIPVRGFGFRGKIVPSPARLEKERRTRRSSSEVARILQNVYGREFSEAVYVPGMALIARIRMGEVRAVRALALPFADGTRDSLAKATGSHLAGHLVFAELAEKTGDLAWTKLVRRAADLGFVDGETSMRESMPFHNEMSDAMFMGTPLLAKAGKLTGEKKYFEMALRQFRFVQSLCLREDGIYRHSPLSEAAWGRGNAFPLLGLALTLEDFPREHAGYGEMLAAYRALARALLKYQDRSGLWHEVITVSASYAEFSATAMIGRSLLIGIGNRWLDDKVFRPSVNVAWKATNARISDNGDVVDVCESTGKQASEEAYLKREAILGHDARGGGMALLFALDMSHFLFQ